MRTLVVLALIAWLGSAARADVLTWYMERQVTGDKLDGRVARVDVPLPALNGTRRCWIYTPPGYGEKSAPLPVLVLLHGTPGGAIDWLYRGGAHRTLDQAIHRGAFPAALVVCPDGSGPYWKGGSEWADAADGRCAMETALARDLPAFLKSHYRVAAGPEKWAVGGLSEGGLGAANLVLRHPDVFRNALVISGDLLVSDDWPDAQPVFGDSARRLRYSPLMSLHELPAELRPKVHFYVAVGTDDDADLVDQADRFAARCKKLGVPVRLDRDPGAHKWSFWSGHLKAGLEPLAGWLREGAP